jgi:predicted NAD/FAD-dependent oxidoreductase
MSDSAPSVAIIGGGVSGLLAARELTAAGVRTIVYDKARGPGGRLATRRVEDVAWFNHGAQYFTIRSDKLQPMLQKWLKLGVVRIWEGPVVRLHDGVAREEDRDNHDARDIRYIGSSGNNALAKHLAANVDYHPSVHVHSVQRSSEGDGACWRVIGPESQVLGEFGAVLLALPSPQVLPLLSGDDPIALAAGAVKMRPTWAVMVKFKQSLALPWRGAFVESSPLSWAMQSPSPRGSVKDEPLWVLHGSHDWSEANLERAPEEIVPLLMDAFATALGRELPAAEHSQAHRWRYAAPASRDPLRGLCLFDDARKLGCCGDWCAGGRVEGAMLSGLAAAEQLIDALKRP